MLLDGFSGRWLAIIVASISCNAGLSFRFPSKVSGFVLFPLFISLKNADITKMN